jgi:hypothetical protein
MNYPILPGLTLDVARDTWERRIKPTISNMSTLT